MSISRRNFMKILAGATATAAGIGVPAVLYLSQDDDEDTIPRSTGATPSPTPLPEIDIDSLIPTLLAATSALFINYDIEPTHYEVFFRYQVANLEGYATLYHHFVMTLDSEAQTNGQASFADSDLDIRRSILNTGLQHIINNDFQDASANILTDAPTWEHYARFFLRGTLSLFMYTDAWIIIGYDGWPGMSRGLDRYRQPITFSDPQLLG